MRIVTYGAACSLDGFIAAGDGALDWLHFSRDVEKAMDRYWSGIDAVLMGRKTWEFSARMNPAAGATGPADGNGPPSIRTYIFSARYARRLPGRSSYRPTRAGLSKSSSGSPARGSASWVGVSSQAHSSRPVSSTR